MIFQPQTARAPAVRSWSDWVSRPRLQRKCACGGPAGVTGECEECSKKKRLGLQTKLKVNEPGDTYEQEADRIADQVISTRAHPGVSGAQPRIQRFSGQSIGQMDAAPASVDQTLASPGRPLEPALRQDMEQRFDYDFSRVRVHSGAVAERSAREVNASAYTVGHDIVFGAGRFAPGAYEGRRLIAHELTHVVQQSGAEGRLVGQAVAFPALQRKPDGKSPSEAADPIDEESFPEYAWHLVGSTSTHGSPSAPVIRVIIEQNTDIDRNLLAATKPEFSYRRPVKGGPIRPSYFSFRHPTKGIVARAFAELEAFHPERKPDAKRLLKESHSYKVYVFSPHSGKDPGHYAFPMPLSSAPPLPDVREQAGNVTGQSVSGKSSAPPLPAVLTTSVGEFYAQQLTPDELRSEVAVVVGALGAQTLSDTQRQVLELNLQTLEDYASAQGVQVAAATAYRLRQVLGALATDLLALASQLKKILRTEVGGREVGEKYSFSAFQPEAIWDLQQLTWATDALSDAFALTATAEAGGAQSTQQFHAAGIRVTAVLFESQAVAIHLAYLHAGVVAASDFGAEYTIASKVGVVREELEPMLQELRSLDPARVERAVKELQSPWHGFEFDFSSFVEDLEEHAHTMKRIRQVVAIIELAMLARGLMRPRGGGGPPISGGPGISGATAGVAVARGAVGSAEWIEAMRRLVAIGAISTAAAAVGRIGGGTAGTLPMPAKPTLIAASQGKPPGSEGGGQTPTGTQGTVVAAAPKGKGEYTRLPGREPDIGVMEIRADGSVSIVLAHREDVRALTGSNTHIAIANAPEGLGPITEGARRYRFYLQNKVVTSVEPLGKAAQTSELVGVIGRALQRNRLASPNGTSINLSPGQPDETLKGIIFSR